MRVANVNMTKTSSSCPAGLDKVTSPKSLCRKRVNTGCSSVEFSTHAVPFSKVCGRVIGIQYYTIDAFHPYYTNQGRTIDDSYVDGVSITHSSSLPGNTSGHLQLHMMKFLLVMCMLVHVLTPYHMSPTLV